MSRIVTIRRQLTNRTIAENPSGIVLTRIVREKNDAGGYTDTETTLPAQTFRLFISTRHATKDIAQVGGQMQIRIMEMLCPWDADVMPKDTFIFDDKNYRVHGITVVRFDGQILSYQCEIEEIT